MERTVYSRRRITTSHVGEVGGGGKGGKDVKWAEMVVGKLNEIPKGDRSGRGEGLRPKSAI